MLRLTIQDAVEDLLFGPTIEDIQHMIEPDAGLRILRQASCEHKRRDWVRCMCLDCGETDIEQWREKHQQWQGVVRSFTQSDRMAA